ncbi:MAG TPA: hypothetical protein VL651_17540 [Bacteroidia bacterium]|jgi:hypothetical protein|nr:hypothetical protein [Bacteroidia bacterium]
MEIFDTAGPESIGNEKEKNSRIAKNAIRFFGAGASIVFFIAMYYCYTSGHRPEMGALATGYVVLGLLGLRIYKTL